MKHSIPSPPLAHFPNALWIMFGMNPVYADGSFWCAEGQMEPDFDLESGIDILTALSKSLKLSEP